MSDYNDDDIRPGICS